MSKELIQVGNVDQKGHNSLWGRVYSPMGISSTLNANGGGMGAKTGLYAISCAIRGRNSEGKIVQMLEVKDDGICNSLTTVQKDAMVMQYKIKSNTKDGFEYCKDGDCINYTFINSKTRRGRVGRGYAQTLDTACNIGVINGFMIRRLMPFETFRIQGVKKEDIRLVVSDTQAYRISGNAISVNVMQELLKAIYKKESLGKTSLFDF